MTEDSAWTRRRFLGTTMMTLAAAKLGSETRSTQLPTFGPVKQIDAGVLNVGYVDLGPRNGTPILLLHGWPYDIHSFAEVAPVLASAGHRVIVPYVRGYGTTHFLSERTPRNGQPAALAADTLALMD